LAVIAKAPDSSASCAGLGGAGLVGAALGGDTTVAEAAAFAEDALFAADALFAGDPALAGDAALGEDAALAGFDGVDSGVAGSCGTAGS
jgi:hypothetical protein